LPVALGLALAAALILVVGRVALPDGQTITLIAVVGALMGATMPSRDMLVRSAAPPGASGKVFGFVYSGLDLGASVSPLVVGPILDAELPGWVFTFIAASWAATICAAVIVRSRVALRPA
jgi:hypothetical protein